MYRGPTSPVTSVALSPDGRKLFAGCWDKTVWSWDACTREPLHRYVGHTDFVKTVVCVLLDNKVLLISGGADSSIIVWNIGSRKKIHTLKGHTGAIQDLMVDPTSYTTSSSSVTVFSASSDREIRRWTIGHGQSVEEVEAQPIIEHETSVYKLFFDADDDLWTASADGTVKCLSRERGWKTDTVLTHPDFVRDVVVDERGGWVVTACRDEDVRVWNRAVRDLSSTTRCKNLLTSTTLKTGTLHHTFSGHYEEVTGLLLLDQTVVSVSIDATIRKWSLKAQDLRKAVAEAEKARDGIIEEKKEAAKPSLMTTEEERELAELMGDSE